MAFKFMPHKHTEDVLYTLAYIYTYIYIYIYIYIKTHTHTNIYVFSQIRITKKKRIKNIMRFSVTSMQSNARFYFRLLFHYNENKNVALNTYTRIHIRLLSRRIIPQKEQYSRSRDLRYLLAPSLSRENFSPACSSRKSLFSSPKTLNKCIPRELVFLFFSLYSETHQSPRANWSIRVRRRRSGFLRAFSRLCPAKRIQIVFQADVLLMIEDNVSAINRLVRNGFSLN